MSQHKTNKIQKPQKEDFGFKIENSRHEIDCLNAEVCTLKRPVYRQTHIFTSTYLFIYLFFFNVVSCLLYVFAIKI